MKYDKQVIKFPVQVAADSYLTGDGGGGHVDVGQSF